MQLGWETRPELPGNQFCVVRAKTMTAIMMTLPISDMHNPQIDRISPAVPNPR